MSKKPKVLYLSYDGMTDPLGQSQVIAYLKILSGDFDIHLLSFDKPENYVRNKLTVENLLAGTGITWITLKYHKNPPVISTLIDLRAGWKKIREFYKTASFDIVHCRGYITPILGLKCKRKYGSKLIFDMRGWWPDEKLESGLWNAPIYLPVYKYFKKLEEKFFKQSDYAISLTEAGKKEIIRLGYKNDHKIGVIPTCVNFEVFKPFDETIRHQIRKELSINPFSTVLLYSGSLGGNYGTDLLMRIFKALKDMKPDSILLILSRTDENYIRSQLAQHSISSEDTLIVAADYLDVYKYLMAGDIGVIVYKTSYSVIGRSPTKLGEYWACGLPALALSGIGDLNFLLQKYPLGGVLIESMQKQDVQSAINKALNMVVSKQQLREYAKDYYDLEKGAVQYKSIYTNLLSE